MRPQDLIRSSRDPAFACDSECRIVAWNRAAEELLGVASRQAIGKAQHDLVPARDAYGNRFCSCVVHPLASRGEVVRHQYIVVPTASREWLRVSLCTVAFTGPGTTAVHLHFLRPIAWGDVDGEAPGGTDLLLHSPNGSAGLHGRSHPAADPPAVRTASRWRLTGREVDVLRLMMDGKGAKESAQALEVSTATVRNHIRSLLRKLKVHSKLEAVALVMRAAVGSQGHSAGGDREIRVE